MITGACGFVGRHLVETTLQRGLNLEVIACDLHEPDAMAGQEFPGRFRFLKLDVRDAEACARFLLFTTPTHVIHTAAITDGDESDLMAVNVEGVRNLLNAVTAENSSVRRFILLSSSAVYGAPRGDAPCDERHPLDLRGAYARSKRQAEEYLLQRAPGSRVSMAAARLGPCFGPGEIAGIYRPSVSLVGRLLATLRTGETLRMCGEDYSRDWTHLDDIHDALMGMLFSPRLQRCLYNVSTGVPVSVYELVRCLEYHGLRVEWTEATEAEVVLRAQDGRAPLVIDRLCEDTGFAPATDWKRRIAELIASTPRV